MKQFILALLVLCLSSSISISGERQKLAGGFSGPGGQLAGFWAVPSGGVQLTFTNCYQSTTDLTTYTFASSDVGIEAANRHTIVGVLAIDDATGFSTNSVTVGGVSATEIVDQGGTVTDNASIHILANPSGTSEDIVVTMSEAMLNAAICVWAAYGLSSATAHASIADPDTNSSLALSLNTPANGIAVGVAINDANPPNVAAWTGLIEQYDNNSSGMVVTAAHLHPTSAATPLSVTAVMTPDTPDAAGAAASWAP